MGRRCKTDGTNEMICKITGGKPQKEIVWGIEASI
jgi:hypothetical protein